MPIMTDRLSDSQSGLRLWGLGTVRTIRPLWALLELDLVFTHEEILTRTPSMETDVYRNVSPRQKIPMFDDGELRIGESAAICLYLAVRYRDSATLAPNAGSAARARHDELCWFAMTEMDSLLYTIRRHEGLPLVYGESQVAVDAARDYFIRSSGEIERRLSDGRKYLVDSAFSVADILVKSCLDWASIYKIELPEASQAYAHRLSERPAFQEAMKQNFTPKAMAALAGDPKS